MRRYLAIDIGASSGRHIVGTLDSADGTIKLQEVYRFPNEAETLHGNLRWNLDKLYGHVLNGLKAAREQGLTPDFVGIDTWGVDYVLLDRDDRILGDSVAYRDARTEGVDALLEKRMSYPELYRHTGIAKNAFNTVYQLFAQFSEHPEHRELAQSFLMIPDYLGFLLTGAKRNEYTIASTTGMLNVRTRNWDKDVLNAAGIPQHLFRETPAKPGTALGRFSEAVKQAVGYDAEVVLPPTHDTGSAFVAVPAQDEHAVFLSSGTWSLLGAESREPLADDASREAGFTNEGGYAGTYRYLRNIMGMWPLQQVRRENGEQYSYAEMAEMAHTALGYEGRVNINDDRFLAPKDMTAEIKAALCEDGWPEPKNLSELLAAIYHGLADCYKTAVEQMAQKLGGVTFTSLNIVGGGSQNAVLNQLTANKTGLTVYAGPTEGTALGNIVVQMLRDGALVSWQEARDVIRRSFEIMKYEPQ